MIKLYNIVVEQKVVNYFFTRDSVAEESFFDVYIKNRDTGNFFKLQKIDENEEGYRYQLNLDLDSDSLLPVKGVQNLWDIMISVDDTLRAVKAVPKSRIDIQAIFEESVMVSEEYNVFVQHFLTESRTVGFSLVKPTFDLPNGFEPKKTVEKHANGRAGLELLYNDHFHGEENTINAIVFPLRREFFKSDSNLRILEEVLTEYKDMPAYIPNYAKTSTENIVFSENVVFYEPELDVQNELLIKSKYVFTGRSKTVGVSPVDGRKGILDVYVQNISYSDNAISMSVIVDTLFNTVGKSNLVLLDRDQDGEEPNLAIFSMTESKVLSQNSDKIRQQITFKIDRDDLNSYILSDYWMESSVLDLYVDISLSGYNAFVHRELRAFSPEKIQEFDDLKALNVPGYSIEQYVREANPFEMDMYPVDGHTLVISPYSGTRKKLVIQTSLISNEVAEHFLNNNVRLPILAARGNRVTKYYAGVRESQPVDDNAVFYESRDGQSFVDSPLAIFLYLAKQKDYDYLRHYWVYSPETPSSFFEEVSQFDGKVEFVERNSQRYYDLIATAKYLITNSTFQTFFSKRPDQVYINTWHGIPLKKMGFDMPQDPRNAQNVLRNFLMADYFLQPNAYSTDVFIGAYKLTGAFQGEILQGAYPRTDLLFNTDKEGLLSRIGTLASYFDNEKRTVMYSPTWKGTSITNPTDSIEEMLNQIKDLTSTFNDTYNILLKVHPFVYSKVADDERFAPYLVPDSVDANEIMSIVDVLITDYSSIFFDFVNTGKPILFFVPDAKEYKSTRGLYLKQSEMPGPVLNNFAALKRALANLKFVQKKYSAKYKRFSEKYGSLANGMATKEIVDFVFKSVPMKNVVSRKLNSDKRKVVIYPGSLAANGITSSYMNLMGNLDFKKYDVTQIATYDKKSGKRNGMSLPDGVRQMFRIGSPLLTLDEAVIDEYYKVIGLDENNVNNYPIEAYERDAQRLLPNMKFADSIDFSGYSYYWGRLMVSIKAPNKIAYLHNDIWEDAHRKIENIYVHKANVEPMIKLYRLFDKLVSVSPELKKINESKVIQFAGNAKFTSVQNSIDPDTIRYVSWKRRLKPNFPTKDIIKQRIPAFNKKMDNFISMGRLSPEKNQLFLVRVFSKYVETVNENARLYILGDGPLKSVILEEIEKLQMTKHIFLMGHINNPHHFMSKMDTFVLPSLYEGQPMVLLEALTLGMKVLSSDIPQNAFVLNYGQYGELADGTNVNDFLRGIDKINAAKLNQYDKFDPYKYNQEALREFELVLGD